MIRKSMRRVLYVWYNITRIQSKTIGQTQFRLFVERRKIRKKKNKREKEKRRKEGRLFSQK